MPEDRIILTHKELEPLRKLGLIDEIRLRDIHLIREYRRRLKEHPEKKKKEIEQELADEYYMSYENLRFILHREKNKKKQEPIIKELL